MSSALANDNAQFLYLAAANDTNEDLLADAVAV
jgi:hypothetical protein